MLLVGDLIYNDASECNCEYAIYEAHNGRRTCVFSTEKTGIISR